MEVREVLDSSNVDWLGMRGDLWPHLDAAQHQAELESFVADPSRFVAFLALLRGGRGIGFAEVSLRAD